MYSLGPRFPDCARCDRLRRRVAEARCDIARVGGRCVANVGLVFCSFVAALFAPGGPGRSVCGPCGCGRRDACEKSCARLPHDHRDAAGAGRAGHPVVGSIWRCLVNARRHRDCDVAVVPSDGRAVIRSIEPVVHDARVTPGQHAQRIPACPAWASAMWVPSRAARCQKQGESRRESRELRPHLCNAFNTLYPTTLASRLIINSSTQMHFGVLEKNAAIWFARCRLGKLLPVPTTVPYRRYW